MKVAISIWSMKYYFFNLYVVDLTVMVRHSDSFQFEDGKENQVIKTRIKTVCPHFFFPFKHIECVCFYLLLIF